MSPHQPTRKEREKQAHRLEIMAAARKLFLRQDYYETTLEEIAREAQFGKGTIYNYFSSKEELFQAIIDQILIDWEAMTRQIIEDDATDCREKFTRYASQLILHAAENEEMIKLMMRQAKQPKAKERCKKMDSLGHFMERIVKLMAQPLQQEQAQQRVKAVDPVLLALLFHGMLHSTLHHRFRQEQELQEQEIDEAARLIVNLFFDGIRCQSEPTLEISLLNRSIKD
jgi:TetR/AcrR family transcriptional regulator, repressor of fatR-cypB operon